MITNKSDNKGHEGKKTDISNHFYTFPHSIGMMLNHVMKENSTYFRDTSRVTIYVVFFCLLRHWFANKNCCKMTVSRLS